MSLAALWLTAFAFLNVFCFLVALPTTHEKYDKICKHFHYFLIFPI